MGCGRDFYFAVSVKKDYPSGVGKHPTKTTVKTTPITRKNRHFSPFLRYVIITVSSARGRQTKQKGSDKWIKINNRIIDF